MHSLDRTLGLGEEALRSLHPLGVHRAGVSLSIQPARVYLMSEELPVHGVCFDAEEVHAEN